MEKEAGYYFGTEIDGKWWRRYLDDGFFARGNGSYWIGEDGLYFLRYLTKRPLFIPFNTVTEIRVGTAHAGKWVPGITVLKIIWKKNNQVLSSGFRLGRTRDDALRIKQTLDELCRTHKKEEASK